MKECTDHHYACQCREHHFAKVMVENQELVWKLMEIRQSSKGTILNEDGDPLYALIPLRVLNDQ